MSQNKTIVPGINYNDLDKEGAQDHFYDSLYSSTSSNEGHTIIGGGNVMNMQKSANQPISSVNLMSPIKNNGRTLIMKERVIVGVMFSISRGLLGEIFPVYLGKNIIGQTDNCDIVLKENTVSAVHAIIHTRKNENGIEATITDFDSQFGTILNGNDAKYDTLPVRENDILIIGQHYKFILKLFDTDKYDLFEDVNFGDSMVIDTASSLSSYSNDSQINANSDFYSPSARKSNDSSRTIIG